MAETVAIQKRIPGENRFVDLVIGDPWTIIRSEPIQNERGPAEIGDIIQLVHSTDDGGRYFEVAAVYSGSIYETRYIGSFCEVFPDAPDHSGPYRRAVEERRQSHKEIEL